MDRNSIKQRLKSLNWKKMSLGVLVGGSLGFTYYYFIGCNSGACAITSNPINSTGYGAMVGLIWNWQSKAKKG